MSQLLGDHVNCINIESAPEGNVWQRPATVRTPYYDEFMDLIRKATFGNVLRPIVYLILMALIVYYVCVLFVYKKKRGKDRKGKESKKKGKGNMKGKEF